MIQLDRLMDAMDTAGLRFFTGVPDSYLNGFCTRLLHTVPPERNVIAANEGNAVGIAAGHYLATGEVPLVYMQNSGLGNAVNPLASLADKQVYAIPMVLLIGWRGQPGTGDWPQHTLQGEITPALLELMHIPYTLLTDDTEQVAAAFAHAARETARTRVPYGLIAPKGVLAGEKLNHVDASYPMSREEAIETVLDVMPDNTVYSATTGRATRELFWLRERRGEGKQTDFLNVGSMGHASSVALGMAMEKPERPVVCLDGDAACMMHMGALTMMGKYTVPNFLHLALNNGVHESVGSQPSAGQTIDLTAVAAACGYATVGHPVTTKEELMAAIRTLTAADRAGFIDVRIHPGLSRKLPPLDFSHRDAIDALMEELQETD